MLASNYPVSEYRDNVCRVGKLIMKYNIHNHNNCTNRKCAHPFVLDWRSAPWSHHYYSIKLNNNSFNSIRFLSTAQANSLEIWCYPAFEICSTRNDIMLRPAFWHMQTIQLHNKRFCHRPIWLSCHLCTYSPCVSRFETWQPALWERIRQRICSSSFSQRTNWFSARFVRFQDESKAAQIDIGLYWLPCKYLRVYSNAVLCVQLTGSLFSQ